MQGFPFWPTLASAQGREVDHLFIALLAITGLILGLVFTLIIVFAVRYRRGSDADRSALVGKSWRWEVSWTAATLVVFLGLFFWGADLYLRLFRPPPGATEIFVVGQQWMWKIEHPGGQREIDELHLPVGRPVRLVMTSQDVIHSFYLPAFRVKHDVLPGRYETLWFTPTRLGEFPLLCAEFCGTSHAGMGGRVVVMKEEEFARWLRRQGPADDLARQGEALFRSLGCSGCHVGSGPVRAPPLDGLYGRRVPLADGRFVTADERYIRDSILLPNAEVTAGYAPVMPSFAGQIGEEEIMKLIAYIKSLATTEPPR